MKSQYYDHFNISSVLAALQQEFSATADYGALRDQLPHRLAQLLMCHAVLIYLRVNDTLQLASSSFDDTHTWPATLLAIAHINPVSIDSTIPEACAWREQHTICVSDEQLASIVLPLVYRQRSIGVLVAVRGRNASKSDTAIVWHTDETESMTVIASVVALLLEHTRLVEHDRERIHELSLLNSISSQMNCSLYDMDRLRSIILQRTKEVGGADLCEILEPANPPDAPSWVSSALHEQLFAWYHTQQAPGPLIIERYGSERADSCLNNYLALLPTSIQTFIALPLLSTHTAGTQNSVPLDGACTVSSTTKILGIIASGYYATCKLPQTELALLQILAGQAGAAMENMQLMAEVTEARNEARILLRRVLDDQRLKELILESIPSGLITTDQEGRITIFNRAAASILGYHLYEVLGLPLQKFLALPNTASGPSQQTYSPLVQNESSHKLQRERIVMVDRFECQRILEVESVPLYDDRGRRIGTLVTFSDLTSIHHLEQEKRRLDRLATLGEMAANVAHEVRNPLASIKTAIQMLRDDLANSVFRTESKLIGERVSREQEHWALESIAVMLKEVERLDTIVRDLLLFARPHQLHRTRCNITELSDQVLHLIESQSAAANIVVHRLYEDIPPLWVDSGQMEQILLNLFMNAIQAMPEGGILTIICRSATSDHTNSKAHLAINALAETSYSTSPLQLHEEQQEYEVQQWLELVVSDTGVGIANEILENIFQPFYTTKAHGIGLGLPITRRLIEDHGGQIRIESQLGYGATVAVRLPLLTEDLMQATGEDLSYLLPS